MEELGDEKREGGVAKKILMVLSLLGLGALAVKEFPAMMREIKILRMGKAPQGPAWYQRGTSVPAAADASGSTSNAH